MQKNTDIYQIYKQFYFFENPLVKHKTVLFICFHSNELTIEMKINDVADILTNDIKWFRMKNSIK
jgi:hypothetical protein